MTLHSEARRPSFYIKARNLRISPSSTGFTSPSTAAKIPAAEVAPANPVSTASMNTFPLLLSAFRFMSIALSETRLSRLVEYPAAERGTL